MDFLFAISLALFLILIANLLEKQQDLARIASFERMLPFLSIPFLGVGLMFLFASSEQLAGVFGELLTDFNGRYLGGAVMLFIGIWGIAMSTKKVRLIIAQWISINPHSPVHTLALVLSGLLMGGTLFTLATSNLEQLAESAQSVSLSASVLQQVLFMALALFGVGLFLRRDNASIQKRLGLDWPTKEQLWFGVPWIPLLVILQFGMNALWLILNPEQMEQIDSVSSAFLGDIDTLGEWFTLALSAGIGEEVLFRGALQPIFGIVFTSILFAIAHTQYGFTLATLLVFILSIALGYIRHRSNTTVAILVHFGYNFTLGIFAIAASSLEQLVP